VGCMSNQWLGKGLRNRSYRPVRVTIECEDVTERAFGGRTDARISSRRKDSTTIFRRSTCRKQKLTKSPPPLSHACLSENERS
jgi:hypothetical protein